MTANSNLVSKKALKKRTCDAKTASSRHMEQDKKSARSMERHTLTGNAAIVAPLPCGTASAQPTCATNVTLQIHMEENLMTVVE